MLPFSGNVCIVDIAAPPFRKEREMMGKPQLKKIMLWVWGAIASHPFAKNAKWWGSLS
jgi:hypothetical protein